MCLSEESTDHLICDDLQTQSVLLQDEVVPSTSMSNHLPNDGKQQNIT